MVERGLWSLCKTFDAFSDSVDFDASTDYQEVYNVSQKIPQGTYPFSITFKITNSGASGELYVQFKDSDGTLYAEITVDAGKTGLIHFPPLLSLLVYTKGNAGTLKVEAFLASVTSTA